MVLGNEGLCLSMSAVILEWLNFQKLKNVPGLLSVAMKKRGLFFITPTQHTGCRSVILSSLDYGSLFCFLLSPISLSHQVPQE